jgi:uncharacterized membrane protein YccC
VSTQVAESRSLARIRRARRPGSGEHKRPAWLPIWSKPAAFRALRTVIAMPPLFALCSKVFHNPQMSSFAAFGCFATLVLANFNGRRRDKLVAHLGLAVAGSVLLIIGTAVNAHTWIAAAVTVVVAFLVLFSGVAGPNGAGGVAGALLAYVLPAASPGTMSMVPDRLAGWWLASAVSTALVLVLSPKPPGHQLRAAMSGSARGTAELIEVALRGEDQTAVRQAAHDAKLRLMTASTATPFRPTGLATTDQALADLVGVLEWCATVVLDGLREFTRVDDAPEPDRALLAQTARTLRDVAASLDGDDVVPDLDALQRQLSVSAAHLASVRDADENEVVHLTFHARTAAVAARTAGVDALIAGHHASPRQVEERRRGWYGLPPTPASHRLTTRLPFSGGLSSAGRAMQQHTSLRSVWFLNSIRGAVALAAAVAVADLTNVQHAFWVVLGTLSVLRTTAAATGANALRAMLGTTAGFVIGALLLTGLGTSPTVLWIALPIAVLVAGYAPGTAPFAVGQAAFTVTISVLYNLLAPAGWKIGVVRVEDVAIGCAVSLVVGMLFWPRGASAVVCDDLADAYREGGVYLADAVDWALGLRSDPPNAAPTFAASVRLDEGLRGFLVENGTKRVARDDLQMLVMGTTRLRLTAYSLAGLPRPDHEGTQDPARLELSRQAKQAAVWYDHLASRLEHPSSRALAFDPPAVPGVTPEPGIPGLSCTLWVGEHLRHIAPRMALLVEPAARVAEQRHVPWWR